VRALALQRRAPVGGEATAGGGGGHGCSFHRFLLIKQDSSNNLEPLPARSSKMVNKRSIIVRHERPCRAWQQNSLLQLLLGRFGQRFFCMF
jgi:hypothetical protein